MEHDARHLPGKIKIILPAAFLTSMGIGVGALGFLFAVKNRFDASPATVGWFTAIWSVTYFVGCVTLKPLWSRLRPRVSMAAMLGISATAFAAFLAFPSLPMAFACYGVYGFFTALHWPPLMGWLSRGLEGPALSRSANLFNFSWSAGGVAAPVLAGFCSERDAFLPLFVAAGIFAANCAFVLASIGTFRDPSELASEHAEATRGAEDRSTPLRYPAWIGVFLVYAAMGVVFNIFPLFAKDELGLPESRIGFLLTVRALATMGGFTVLARLHGWQFKRALLPALSLFLAAVLGALAFTRAEAGYLAAFFVAGLAMAAIYNNSLFYSTSGALDRDRRVTIHEALLTAGQVGGSVAGGLAYQSFPLAYAFAGLAVIVALGAAAQAVMVSARGVGRR